MNYEFLKGYFNNYWPHLKLLLVLFSQPGRSLPADWATVSQVTVGFWSSSMNLSGLGETMVLGGSLFCGIIFFLFGRVEYNNENVWKFCNLTPQYYGKKCFFTNKWFLGCVCVRWTFRVYKVLAFIIMNFFSSLWLILMQKFIACLFLLVPKLKH